MNIRNEHKVIKEYFNKTARKEKKHVSEEILKA
jgi:hypothetical protein